MADEATFRISVFLRTELDAMYFADQWVVTRTWRGQGLVRIRAIGSHLSSLTLRYHCRTRLKNGLEIQNIGSSGF